MIAKEGNVPIVMSVPEDDPVRDIPMDVERAREEIRTSAEWLVLFLNTLPSTYNGASHPTYLDMWRLQIERIFGVYRVS